MQCEPQNKDPDNCTIYKDAVKNVLNFNCSIMQAHSATNAETNQHAANCHQFAQNNQNLQTNHANAQGPPSAQQVSVPLQ